MNLLRTTTFAGYHDGEEHYVTAFEFAGGGGAFGSITPLPGVPTEVVKGGDWTLQRLVRETTPVERLRRQPTARRRAARGRGDHEGPIDALDITVLRGGADAIGAWAKDQGFRLPPDAPEVLDFYASRSPIFLAAAFDADAAAARGQQVGDGTPVHVTIPTDNPWVPLRILALGKTGEERVEADVYLLTDQAPRSSRRRPATTASASTTARATTSLLDDLRSDRGMEWIPRGLADEDRRRRRRRRACYDLAIDATGAGAPRASTRGSTS